MENKKLPSFVPLGIDLDGILKMYVSLLGVGVISSYQFFHSFDHYLHQMQLNFNKTGELSSDFNLFSLYCTGLGFFSMVFLWCIFLTGYHYYYHLQGSKSLYLMKRLPQKGAFLRRIVTLPIILTIVTLIYVIILLTYYIYIYRAFGMIQDEQWNLLLLLWN